MSAYAHQMEQQYAAASLSDDSGMSCYLCLTFVLNE